MINYAFAHIGIASAFSVSEDQVLRLVETLKVLDTSSTVSPFFNIQSIPNLILLLAI